jgi:pilus assembly protein Flp/PilA
VTRIIHFVEDEAGASAAEYALILAIIGAAIAFAAVALGDAVANAMNGATDCINNPPSTAGGCG